VSGLSYISGLPGEEPSGWGLSYMDNEAAFFNAAALLMAIYNRNLTGKGSEIDVSAVEAGVNLLGPILLEVAVNGRSTRDGRYPTGNRLEHPDAAPHGVYPCLGEDRWIAIAVFDDAEWRGLVTAMGDPDWAKASVFSSQAGRFAHQDDLDARLAAWTRDFDRYALMHRLQASGVPAGAVQTAEDTNDHDPQIASRGVFFDLDHPVIGKARFEGTPIHFTRTVQENWRSAPLLGEDNDHVFGTILGMDKGEIDDLRSEGVI
jgi:benzylsuccinate CoA-transferase BbsF subunit